MFSLVKSYSVVHPLGFTATEVFNAITEGKTALKKVQRPYLSTPVYAALFTEEQNSKIDTLCKHKNFSRFEKLLWLSAYNAIKDAGLSLNSKVLFVIATTKGNIEEIGHAENENLLIAPSVKKVIDSLLPGSPFITISNACISGLSAIIMAKRYMEVFDYDYTVVIGADMINDFVLSGFNSLYALSDNICRPFDKNRNGINLGEGAAAIVLEKQNEIIPRNVYITGGAVTNDANHISGPSRTGMELAEAIKKAVQESHISKFDFISAHGTATLYNDEMESKAFNEMNFNTIPLHSLKPYIGHTLGGAGVIESVICMESIKNNVLIPSKNFAEQGTTYKLNVQTEIERKELFTCIKTMSGFGGCNATICIEKKS